MPIAFSPTRQDVERYRRLRALGVELTQKIVHTVPRQALNEIGDALGILHHGVLILDSEDMSSVVADCCLYEWFENGKNLVQRYSETHPVKPGTDESYLLSAYLQAKYRVLTVQSAVPDAGLYCEDIGSGEELFLMDIALSRSLSDGGVGLATRTIPLGEFWMTGGAGLPIDRETILHCFSRPARGENRPLRGRDSIALTIVRGCLAAGVADRVAYEIPDTKLKKFRREPRWLGSKRRRRPAG